MGRGIANCYAFADGATLASSSGLVSLRCCSVGQVSCPTGRIIVCDAWYPLDAKPFGQHVAPGSYATVVTTAQSMTHLPTQVAYVTLRVRQDTPARWVEAEPRGFAGDNSFACIMDVATAAAWNACFDREGEEGAWARLAAALDRGNPYADFVVDAAANLNMIAWREEGDCGGRFLYGLDNEGNLACITVDTEVLKWAGAKDAL